MIIGIDPSLTGTAVAIGGVNYHLVERLSSAPRGPRVKDRIDRIEDLVYRVMKFIEARRSVPDAVFIEAYAFSRNDAGAKFLAEYGGLLRWHLLDLTDDVYEVAPSTLKKFATGKGTGAKSNIAGHVAKRWGEVFATDDEVDAYVLYQLGLAARGLVETQNKAQAEAVQTVIAPKVKKPRKKK